MSLTHEVAEPPRTYRRIAGGYAVSSELLWPQVSEYTVKMLDLADGMQVLDVACGPGALTLRAAALVAPTGSVTAIDGAAEMLDITEHRAAATGLTNITLMTGDMNRLDDVRPALATDYDVITWGLAISFATDKEAALCSMVKRLRPGGMLAFSSCSKTYFMPHSAVFLNALQTVRPGVDTLVHWDSTAVRDDLVAAAARAGLVDIQALTQNVDVPIATIDEYLTGVAERTGYARLWDSLEPAEQAEVRRLMVDWHDRERPGRPVFGVHQVLGRKPV